MTEEDLRELEEWYLNDGELHQLQILDLISIAKRYNNVQKENAELSTMLRETQIMLLDSQESRLELSEKNREYISYIDDLIYDIFDFCRSDTQVYETAEKIDEILRGE